MQHLGHILMRTSMLGAVVAIGLGVQTPAGAQNAPARPAAAASSGNAQNGRDVFLKYSCYACHGYAAHGAGTAPKLAQTKLAVNIFMAYVRNPRQMVPYSAKVLSDQQLADVWAYLQSLPDSPSAKNIPLLNQD